MGSAATLNTNCIGAWVIWLCWAKSNQVLFSVEEQNDCFWITQKSIRGFAERQYAPSLECDKRDRGGRSRSTIEFFPTFHTNHSANYPNTSPSVSKTFDKRTNDSPDKLVIGSLCCFHHDKKASCGAPNLFADALGGADKCSYYCLL